MKRILVTGSESYIGSVLTTYLKKKGYEVTGLDTGLITDCTLYPTSPIKTIYKDTRQINSKDLEGFDVVVYLAGISNDPFQNFDPKKVYDPVRIHTVKTAKLCKKLGIKFIFSSSCSIYGKGIDSLMDEDSEVFPQTPYSLNKLQIEQDLEKISDKSFAPIVLRFATAFGSSPRMRFDLVLNMFTAMAYTTKKIILNSDGKAWRPLVHVLDICQAITNSIEYKNNTGKPLVLNVGDSKSNYQIIQLAELVKKQIKGCEIVMLNQAKEVTTELIKDRKIQDGVDSRNYKISFEKIRKVFKNYKIKYSVQKGVQEMIKRLEEVGLTKEDFENIKFYRLQNLERLIKAGLISEELEWNGERPDYSKDPEIETERLHLRIFKESDITPSYLKSLNDKSVIGLTESRYRSWSDKEAREYVKNKGNLKNVSMLIGIFTRGKTGKHIGNIRLHSFDNHNKRVEVGILIWDRKEWGKGYATEAMEGILNHIFEVLNLHKTCAEYYSLNKGSEKMFKKLGFKKEGVFKDHFLIDGKYIDAIRVAKYNPRTQ